MKWMPFSFNRRIAYLIDLSKNQIGDLNMKMEWLCIKDINQNNSIFFRSKQSKDNPKRQQMLLHKQQIILLKNKLFRKDNIAQMTYSRLRFPSILHHRSSDLHKIIINYSYSCCRVDHQTKFPSIIFSIDRMHRTQKIQKLFIQNNIERDNFTLVLRLKKKIEELKETITNQQRAIQSFKRDVKTTKINQMQIEIQHLNDQNKRLLLVIEDLKGKNKTSNILSPKKTLTNMIKLQERRPIITQMKIDNKVYEVLKENQMLKKELVNLKINQNLLKKRNSTLNDRSSIFIEKNLIDYEKLIQKKIDLQAEKNIMVEKLKNYQNKISKLIKRNQQLQKIHHRHIAIGIQSVQ